MANWKRVNRLTRCPVCGKPDWCMISQDRSAVICPRTEEGASRYIDGSGYLHVLKHTTEWMDEGYEPHRPVPLPEHNEVLAIRCRQWISDSTDDHIQGLAEKLGVTVRALRALNVGWFAQRESWVFPMLRAGKRLLGVRVRPQAGSKFAIKGSKNALFIPNCLGDTGPIFICEGESDSAAMIDAGLQVIGRPSCNSGSRLIVELLESFGGTRPVVVCIDSDGPGRSGGYTLARQVADHSPRTLVMEPPYRYKDMRDWHIGEGSEEVRVAAERLLEGQGEEGYLVRPGRHTS